MDTCWGWKNLKKYVTIIQKKTSSNHSENDVELTHSGVGKHSNHMAEQTRICPQPTFSISTDKVKFFISDVILIREQPILEIQKFCNVPINSGLKLGYLCPWPRNRKIRALA